jgi:vitellogenic carboxypeptidase-like protein
LNVDVVVNDYAWTKKYNILFVDQPVGAGLSYADLTSTRPFATSLDGNLFIYFRCGE